MKFRADSTIKWVVASLFSICLSFTACAPRDDGHQPLSVSSPAQTSKLTGGETDDGIEYTSASGDGALGSFKDQIDPKQAGNQEFAKSITEIKLQRLNSANQVVPRSPQRISVKVSFINGAQIEFNFKILFAAGSKGTLIGASHVAPTNKDSSFRLAINCQDGDCAQAAIELRHGKSKSAQVAGIMYRERLAVIDVNGPNAIHKSEITSDIQSLANELKSLQSSGLPFVTTEVAWGASRFSLDLQASGQLSRLCLTGRLVRTSDVDDTIDSVCTGQTPSFEAKLIGNDGHGNLIIRVGSQNSWLFLKISAKSVSPVQNISHDSQPSPVAPVANPQNDSNLTEKPDALVESADEAPPVELISVSPVSDATTATGNPPPPSILSDDSPQPVTPTQLPAHPASKDKAADQPSPKPNSSPQAKPAGHAKPWDGVVQFFRNLTQPAPEAPQPPPPSQAEIENAISSAAPFGQSVNPGNDVSPTTLTSPPENSDQPPVATTTQAPPVAPRPSGARRPKPRPTIEPTTHIGGSDGNFFAMNFKDPVTAAWQKDSNRSEVVSRIRSLAASAKMRNFLGRIRPNLPVMTHALVENGAPSEMIFITLIESRYFLVDGFPIEVSDVGAVGPWQFMSSTAQSPKIKLGTRALRSGHADPCDDRANLALSSAAAGRYFHYLFNFFARDPRLALLAYNWGPGNADRASNCVQSTSCAGRHTQSRDQLTRLSELRNAGFDFWAIKEFDMAPSGPINYAIDFIAAQFIGRNPGQYGVIPTAGNFPLAPNKCQ